MSLEQTTMIEAKARLASNMASVKEAHVEIPDYSIEYLMEANHTLMSWLAATGLMEYVHSLDDMPLLKPFWNQLERLDYQFTEEEKEEILKDYLED